MTDISIVIDAMNISRTKIYVNKARKPVNENCPTAKEAMVAIKNAGIMVLKTTPQR